MSIDSAALPQALRRQARYAAGAAAAAHAGSFFLIGYWASFARATAWLGPASAAGVWLVCRLGSLLPQNRAGGGGAVFSDLGPAHNITLLRGVLTAQLAGFVLLPWPRMNAGPLPWPWLPGALYGAAVILDGVDGWIARRSGRITRMGAQLDMETDAMGLLAASAVAVAAGKLPPALLAAGLAYYLLSGGVWIRTWLGKPSGTVRPWQGARVIAGFQMAVVAAALLPPVGPRAAALAGWIVLVPLLTGFVRDWLIICRRATNDCFTDAWWGRMLHGIATRWAPVGGRFAALLAAASWLALQPWRGESAALAIAATFVGAGMAGRTAALIIVWISGAWISGGGPGAGSWVSWEMPVLFAASMVVLMTGTGPGSLWRPEDRLFARRAGVRRC